MIRSVAVVLVTLLPSLVFAHAEEPSAEQYVFVGNAAVTKANFGLVSDQFVGMVCEEAFVGGDSWKLAALGETEWIVAGENNIQRTTDGCEFEPVQDVGDLIVPGLEASPNSTFVSYIANAGAGEGIWLSDDRGVTFERITFETTDLQLTALRFVDDETFIVSGYDPNNDGEGFLLAVSTGTRTTQNITIGAGIRFPYILDANPNGIVWLGREQTLTVFWGDVADPSARSYIPRTWPTAATISEDGATAWLSGVENGKGIARGDLAGTWDVILPDQVASCVTEKEGTLYFCGLERRDGADVFRLTSDTAFEPVVVFSDLRGARETCPADSDVGTVCPLVWNEIASYFGQEPASEDMGSADDVGVSMDMGNNTITDTGTEPPTEENKGCCATTRSPRSGFVLIFAFVVLAGCRRRT